MRYYLIFLVLLSFNLSAKIPELISQVKQSDGFVEGHIEKINLSESESELVLKLRASHGLAMPMTEKIEIKVDRRLKHKLGEHVLFFFKQQGSTVHSNFGKMSKFYIKKIGGVKVLLNPYRRDTQMNLASFYEMVEAKLQRKIYFTESSLMAQKRFKRDVLKQKMARNLGRSLASTKDINHSHQSLHALWLVLVLGILGFVKRAFRVKAKS